MKNTQYLSAEEVLARWQIKPFDLLEMVKNGVIAWKTDRHMELAFLFDLKDLQSIFFTKTDVEAFEKEHPEYLPQNAPYVTPQGEIPPYLCNKHVSFSKELFIAIEAWLAIYDTPGGLNPEKKHKKQILSWLEKHHSDLSQEAKNRIATMVNADNKGGAERTSF